MAEDSAEAIAKIVVGVGALLVTAAFAWNNTKNSNDKIHSIEEGPAIVFNSVAECLSYENKQSACNTSRGIADSEAHSLGTQIKYSFRSSCEKEHGKTCEYNYRSKGKSFYSPAMLAWQARQDDIKIAVPLYGTQTAGQYMRTDKKIISAALSALPASAPRLEGTF